MAYYRRERRTRHAGLWQINLPRRFKNTPQVPTPADPRVVASAQTGTNVASGVANATLQNTNQITPYGSTTFNPTSGYVDPSSGQYVPQFTETTQLNPLAQSILTGTQETGAQLIPTGKDLATQAGGATTTPLNFNTADSPILNSAPQLINNQASGAIYDVSKGFLDPQWNLQETQLHDQLSKQGIPVGSDAYNSAMTQFNNAKTQAYKAASDQAVAGGVQGGQNLFNMALAGQQQNIGQQQAAQRNPLQLLSMIYGGGGATGGATA